MTFNFLKYEAGFIRFDLNSCFYYFIAFPNKTFKKTKKKKKKISFVYEVEAYTPNRPDSQEY